MNKYPVLLASGSLQRKAILEELSISYQAIAMDVDEVSLPSPADTVRENAKLKLLAALPQALPGQPVLAADTVVWAQGRVLGKPGSPEEARRYLQMLSGKTIEAYSGVAIALKGAETAYVATEKASFSMKYLDESAINWYISTKEPILRAGAIGISHYGEAFVARIDGSYSCIAGLPKIALLAILERDSALAEAILSVPIPQGVLGDTTVLETFPLR